MEIQLTSLIFCKNEILFQLTDQFIQWLVALYHYHKDQTITFKLHFYN